MSELPRHEPGREFTQDEMKALLQAYTLLNLAGMKFNTDNAVYLAGFIEGHMHGILHAGNALTKSRPISQLMPRRG